MSTNFELNYQRLFELNITPESTATWARMAKGLTTADPSNNEETDQTKYLDGNGAADTEVIAFQHSLAFSGHRVVGDTVQDYILSLLFEIGSARRTQMRYTDANGNIITGDVTIKDIDNGGGDAAAKSEISFTVDFNGKPTRTPASAAAALSAVVAAGSAVGTTKATATTGASNHLGYKLKAATQGTVYGSSYVFGYTTYTSGDDIKATAGQYLCVYEIDANERVVKYYEEALTSDDIKA